MNTVFIFVLNTGDVWAGDDISVEPAGTVVARFRVNSGLRLQKLGTISGTSPSVTCSGGTTSKFDRAQEKV